MNPTKQSNRVVRVGPLSIVCETRSLGPCPTTTPASGSAAAWVTRGGTVGGVFSLLLVLGDGGCGCGGDGAPTHQGTETDGVITTGVDSGGSADETGPQVPYYCLYNEDNPMGLVGVKHQCNLEYDLDISFTVTPPFGPSFQVPLSVSSVQTLNDSTYEHPFVMACCTDVTTHENWPFDDSCAYEHHKACLSDFIEHICDAPGVWLEQTAPDFVGQGAEAIEGASKWFKEHRQDCYNHFWTGPDDLSHTDPCDSEFDDRFNHTPWEPTESWAYRDPFTGLQIAAVSNVSIAPHSSLDEHVPQPPPSPATSCTLPDSNNGETPPLSGAGGGGTLVSAVAPVSIDVVGPKLAGEVITGAGAFGTDSALVWRMGEADTLELERWTMVEHAATTVGTSSIRASVDGFKLDLLRAPAASTARGGWQIGAKDALFNLIATVDGTGANVQATNATPIELSMVAGGVGVCPGRVASCLVSQPFSIDYEDALGQSWTLSIPATTWTP